MTTPKDLDALVEKWTDEMSHEMFDGGGYSRGITSRVLKQCALEWAKEVQKNRCEHCGSDRIYSGPPDCPTCGAPNCCQTCCKLTTTEKDRDQWKARAEKAEETISTFKQSVSSASIGLEISTNGHYWFIERPDDDSAAAFMDSTFELSVKKFAELSKLKEAKEFNDCKHKYQEDSSVCVKCGT